MHGKEGSQPASKNPLGEARYTGMHHPVQPSQGGASVSLHSLLRTSQPMTRPCWCVLIPLHLDLSSFFHVFESTRINPLTSVSCSGSDEHTWVVEFCEQPSLCLFASVSIGAWGLTFQGSDGYRQCTSSYVPESSDIPLRIKIALNFTVKEIFSPSGEYTSLPCR